MAGKKKAPKKSEMPPLGKGPTAGSDAGIPEGGAHLRRQAEEMMLKQPSAVDKIPPADVQRIVHELQVHQIELEMQNQELRRTQRELEASREKYFDLYDLAPVGYITLNEKVIILEANIAAAALLGRERSHLIGQPLPSLIYREDQDLFYLCHKKLVETNTRQVCEMRMVRKDGVPFWVRFDISSSQGINDTTETRVVIIDISERKLAEERSSYLGSFPRLNPNPVIEIDSSGKVIFCNPAVASVLESQGMDKGNIRAFLPSDFDDILRSFDQAIESTLYREATVKDLIYGETLFLAPQCGTIRLYAYNITELKRAEKEIGRLNDDLTKRNEELELSNKELESFIYSVSHDLRAPLRHISGFTDLVLKGMSDRLDEKGKRYLSGIHDGAEKMSRLIDDLLNLSKISRQEIQRREVNLSEIAASIVTELQEAHPDRIVEVDIKGGLTAFADRGLIEIVFSNLLGNTWKFTREADLARIEIGSIELDGKIIYYIRDNGAGFDQKYAGKMFWPFHRLHSEESFEGTGIGLAIVDRIIRLHGGKVWAEGIEGKGATIYFSLN